VEPSPDWVEVAGADELEIDQMKLVRVGNERIVLARSESGYVAFSDHCTHRGGSLAGGVMACGTVTCPWHGSQFAVATGRVVAGPASDPIRTFPVETRDDRIVIRTGG
jgi:nitrite reductase/ring-hydroxylating ferredoxin subunit